MSTAVKPDAKPEDKKDDKKLDDGFDWAKQIAADAERRRLIEENAELKRKLEKPADAPKPPTLEAGDAFNKPEKLLEAFGALMERTVGPLRNDMENFKRNQIYENLKRSVKARNPQFAQTFGSIESAVDIEMEGKAPTEENFSKAIRVVLGDLVLTRPELFTGKPVASDPPPKPDHPPHLAPSAPKKVETDPNAPIDMSQFDENEIRLMRERGLNAKQWLALKNTPESQLTKEKWQEIKNMK